MVTWRAVVVGAVCIAAVAGCGADPGEGGDDDDTVVRASAASATAPAAAAASAAPPVTAISEPATVSTPADRVDEPLTVHWVGGSDIAWNDYSLPDDLLADLPTFGERPIVMRTRIVQAVMPVEMRTLVEDAVAAGADAIVTSVNPVWLHWDGSSCLGTTAAPHDFYRCLLTPTSAEVTAQRTAELQALFAAFADAGVPVYVYTQPHSAEVLANPAVASAIEAAEAALAGFDPGVPTVRVRSRIFTRDTTPMREGVEFFDMVHPTPIGTAVMSDWIAADLADFWRVAGVRP